MLIHLIHHWLVLTIYVDLISNDEGNVNFKKMKRKIKQLLDPLQFTAAKPGKVFHRNANVKEDVEKKNQELRIRAKSRSNICFEELSCTRLEKRTSGVFQNTLFASKI